MRFGALLATADTYSAVLTNGGWLDAANASDGQSAVQLRAHGHKPYAPLFHGTLAHQRRFR